MDLLDLTVNQLKRATAIKVQIETLNKELRSILGAAANVTAAPKKRRGRSTAGNRRGAANAPTRAGKRKKKVFSAATRAKLSARLKAYWAAKRAGKK
jgi:hypothetical protein